MAKQDYLFRHLNIIKKLRRSKEATFNEIIEYLKGESDFHDRYFKISNRTFQRDLNEIRSLFKIDIQYNFSSKVYYKLLSRNAGAGILPVFFRGFCQLKVVFLVPH